jgi:DNA-binding NtrC family response regulator
VGKSTLAKLIHKLSGRAGRFISCSAGEIGDSLAHSFLFGHVRGAFTGAIGSRTGVFESAASGTLLLDDFANLSTPVQCALLRVLEERAFTPVGASRDVPVTCRELYATTQSLETLAREDTLVPDFLSRIGEMVIEIPPLRERPEDILPLAEYYLVCAAHEFEREPGTLSADVCQLFVEYPWPHNIRELKGVIERAVIHAHDEGSPEVTPDHIPERLLHGIGQPSAKQPMSEELVVKTLIKTDGNVSATARELQRHRNTVYRYLPARARRKKLSVDDPRL